MSDAPRFEPGDMVSVRRETHRDPPGGHYRTPFYIRGKRGRISSLCGPSRNPETKAYGGDGLPMVPVYRVLFEQTDVWGTRYVGRRHDRLEIEIYDHWLVPVTPGTAK